MSQAYREEMTFGGPALSWMIKYICVFYIHVSFRSAVEASARNR